MKVYCQHNCQSYTHAAQKRKGAQHSRGFVRGVPAEGQMAAIFTHILKGRKRNLANIN